MANAKPFTLIFLCVVHCVSAARFRSQSILRTGATRQVQLLKPFETLSDMLDEGPVFPEVRLRSRDVISADTSAEAGNVDNNALDKNAPPAQNQADLKNAPQPIIIINPPPKSPPNNPPPNPPPNHPLKHKVFVFERVVCEDSVRR
jgi:hypothetical protein